MKIPYKFDFKGDSSQLTTLHQLPLWCTYSLKAAEKPDFFLWKEAEIVSQRINQQTFFLDLVELQLQEDLVIPFDITEKNLSLLFMLEGEASFSTHKDNHINIVRNNRFLISFFNPGRFLLKVKAGNHILLLITINPEWIETKLKRLTKIQKIVEMFHGNDNSYEVMLQCRINRHIRSWIKKIFNYSQNNTGKVDGNLKTCVSSILKYYDDRINSGNHDLAEQVKFYIEQNFSDPSLNVKLLADKFCVTRFTLLNHFKRRYRVSVQEFLTTTRMEKALQMMKNTGASASEVYDQVGYIDVRSFYSTLANYRKRKTE